MHAALPDLTSSLWLKSSHSNPSGGDCLEVAVDVREFVPVRDSKRPGGPTLEFTTAAWSAFIEDVKGG